jgi:uncharacterized lipoprotein YajG
MRYLLLLAVLMLAGCQAGFDTRLQKPQDQYAPPTPYQFRYDPYTGQQLRQ